MLFFLGEAENFVESPSDVKKCCFYFSLLNNIHFQFVSKTHLKKIFK